MLWKLLMQFIMFEDSSEGPAMALLQWVPLCCGLPTPSASHLERLIQALPMLQAPQLTVTQRFKHTLHLLAK